MRRFIKAAEAVSQSHHSRRGRVQHPEYVLGCWFCQTSDYAADVIQSAIRRDNPEEWLSMSSHTPRAAVASLELALGIRLGDRIATSDQVRAGGGGAR